LTLLQYVDAKSTETLSIYNPVDDSLVVSGIQVAGPRDVDDAVAAATAAFKTGPWRSYTGQHRAACMLKMADLLTENNERLAKLETLAMGQPISISKRVITSATVIWRCELSAFVFEIKQSDSSRIRRIRG
jgi:aldehyde dehydrogenase (NAD+)